MDLEIFTPEQKIVQEKIKNEIKMLGIAISEDLLEGIFYDYFVKYQAWNEVLDELLGNELPSDQLDKLKLLNSTTEDLTMKIASEPQNQTKNSAIYSPSLEEAMIVEEDPVPSHEENPVANHEEKPVANHEENLASNQEDSDQLLIEELEGEKARFESLFSTQNLPTVKEIAKFCDKLTSAEKIKCPRQSEIKRISEKFETQIIKFAESMADVIKTQFSQQEISEYIYAFAFIEDPFKVLADLTKIPKVSNSLRLKTIFWSTVKIVVSKVIDSKEAALNIIRNFYPNGIKREYNDALTCHLKSLEKAKWIDKYVDHHSCQQFSSEIKKEFVECVEKFTEDIKKIDLDDEKNKWVDEISAIESKVNILLGLKLPLGDLKDVFAKFSKQVQDKKATFFANIMKEFSMDRLKNIEPNSLDIPKTVTALEGLKRIQDCDKDAQYKTANTVLYNYLERYFTSITKCFQQLKTDINNVMNPKNYLKDSLEVSLESIRKNSKFAAGYLDNLKSIKDKYFVLHAFIPKEVDDDSFLNNLSKFRKSLAIEVERLCSETHSIMSFHSKLQIIEILMELDGHISSDDESFRQLYEKHSQNYAGQIQKIFNNAILDLKKDKLQAVVATMKELKHTSPELFSKLQMELENYINDLVEKTKEEAVSLSMSLSPSLLFDRSDRIANGLSVLEEAKIHIPKEYLPYSYNKIVDCITRVEENMSKKISNNLKESKAHARYNSHEADSIQSADISLASNVTKSVIRKANRLSESDVKLNLNKIKFEQFTPKITKAIENKSGLLFLCLNDCGLKTLRGFPKLAELYSCKLANNEIAGSELRYLTHLSQLHELSLRGNLISDFEDLEPLTELENLTYLNLIDCPIAGQKDYQKQVFARFCGLQELDKEDGSETEDDEKYDKKKSFDKGRKKVKKSGSDNDQSDDRLSNYDDYCDEVIDPYGDDVEFPIDDDYFD